MSGNFFRNYAVALTSPTAWIGLFLIVGLILIWTKKQRLAKWCFTLGTCLFVLFAFDPFTEILLNNFENKYPAFKLESLNPKQQIKYVVVLAGGYVPNPPIHPLTTELTRHTLARVVEGVKIHNEIPGSVLVFTGKGWAPQSEAKAMQQLALGLGVKAEEIILEEESTNTFDHTTYLKTILKDDPFVLVTSAIHMPRSMGLFLKAGYKPIPAPTAHALLGEYGLFNMKVPFASGDNLEAIDLWFNEFFAMGLAKFKGRI
jgi:uncharacterized SAM-binding protein YcdF (DUF218 family)